MKRATLPLLAACLSALACVSVSPASTSAQLRSTVAPDDEPYPAPAPSAEAVLVAAPTFSPIRVSSAFKRLPPLQLPDITGRLRNIKITDRKWLQPQLLKSKQVIAFYANPKYRWITAPSKVKCWAVPWQRQCTVARAKLRLHHALAEAAQYRLDHELPLINDWRTAVRYIQRIYPGTESWLLYISQREGGWGRWVWYGGRPWTGYHIGDDFLGADTVGGQLQFRYSTFAPYWRQAQADLKRRGYIVPDIPMPPEGGPVKYAAWLSPLGQALTGGYMKYYGKEGCHWCL